ncbi:MAG: hypothetical protein AAF481_08595 [Acidobacteriota bacterium]
MLRALSASVLLCAAITPAVAHESAPVPARLTLGPENAYHLEVKLDLYPLATGRPPGHGGGEARREFAALSADQRSAAIERLEALLERRLRLRLDGEVANPEVLLPDLAGAELGDRVILRGVAPEGVETIQVSPSRALPGLILSLHRTAAGEAEETASLPRGEAGPVWTFREPSPPAVP